MKRFWKEQITGGCVVSLMGSTINHLHALKNKTISETTRIYCCDPPSVLIIPGSSSGLGGGLEKRSSTPSQGSTKKKNQGAGRSGLNLKGAKIPACRGSLKICNVFYSRCHTKRRIGGTLPADLFFFFCILENMFLLHSIRTNGLHAANTATFKVFVVTPKEELASSTCWWISDPF